MDFTLYWFMLPLSTLVATGAMLGGIGGSAMFIPIFLILFPLLGPEYALASPIAAIGVALLTESFGFSSGLVGYLKRGLVDFGVARTLIIVAAPASIAGAFLSQMAEPNLLKILYGILMLILAFIFLRSNNNNNDGSSCTIGQKRILTASDGTKYNYQFCNLRSGRLITGLGGFITGMMSVGIGEVIMPQLVKRCQIPIAVAAATSVMIVIVTVTVASFTHITSLITEGGFEAVPWHLVVYTIPGVIIGGQIGTRLQGRISTKKMEKGIGILFGLVGISMFLVVLMQ